MGLDRKSLPDSLLKRVNPADRRAAGLPPPVSEIVSRAAAKSDLKREKELQIEIENWLRLRGLTAIRSRMDRKTSNNVGTPDFIFAVRGRAVALEAKLPGKRPTPEQERFLCALVGDGWFVSVVHTLDEARAAVTDAESWAWPTERSVVAEAERVKE
jgi:hypothetical protein